MTNKDFELICCQMVAQYQIEMIEYLKSMPTDVSHSIETRSIDMRKSISDIPNVVNLLQINTDSSKPIIIGMSYFNIPKRIARFAIFDRLCA